MLIVKNVFVAVALLFSTAAASYVEPVSDTHGVIARDGEYIGLERIPNLAPAERDAAWFHENTLLIRNDEAILDKVPITIWHGRKEYSASDGGFLTYRARFKMKNGQSFVALRLFRSEYVIFAQNKHDQYTEIKTYPVTFVSGRIEVDGVRYRPTVLRKPVSDRLVHLLSREPLDEIDAGR